MRKMNAQGIYDTIVHIVSARYDGGERECMYILTDFEQKELPGETPETRLK